MFVLVASLICCIVYYFYHVFSTAIYSRIIIESPSQRVWPTTIVCEKQAFTFSKIAKVRVSLRRFHGHHNFNFYILIFWEQKFSYRGVRGSSIPPGIVNPIQTRGGGGRLCPPYYYLPPGFENLSTSLERDCWVLNWTNPFSHSSFRKPQSRKVKQMVLSTKY